MVMRMPKYTRGHSKVVYGSIIHKSVTKWYDNNIGLVLTHLFVREGFSPKITLFFIYIIKLNYVRIFQKLIRKKKYQWKIIHFNYIFQKYGYNCYFIAQLTSTWNLGKLSRTLYLPLHWPFTVNTTGKNYWWKYAQNTSILSGLIKISFFSLPFVL